MASTLIDTHFLDGIPVSLQIIAVAGFVFLLSTVYSLLSAERPLPGLPVVTVDGLKPLASWIKRGNETLREGYTQYPGQAFQVVTGTGPKIILPNKYAEEVKTNRDLSLNGAFAKDFFTDLPGFEGTKIAFDHEDNQILQDTARTRLTQSLGLITLDLTDEATEAIHDIFGENAEWHTVPLKDYVVALIARMSSRTFLGKPLCRNEQWLQITAQYALGVFTAARELRAIPAIVRPVMQYFTPSCSTIRKQVSDAKILITDEVARRTKAAHEAIAQGRKPAKTSDAIGWMVELSKGKNYDLVAGQLALSIAAIQTTNEAFGQVLLDMCEHPEIIQPMREEAIRVLTEHGWTKNALYQLKLMDSMLKESQRYHRPRANLNRSALKNVTLSDGIKIPKGRRLLVETVFFDPKIYPEPYKFDPYRFLRLRERPDNQNKDWQYISVSPEFMAFGYGIHACPGRFFVTNEMKIALCHLLLKYEWRMVPGQARKPDIESESAVLLNPMSELQIRRREEEIDLLSPAKSVA